jgi:hypothetical protein
MVGSAPTARRAVRLLARDAEGVEAVGDVGDDLVDLGVGTVAGAVDRPRCQPVAEPVELGGREQERGHVGVRTRRRRRIGGHGRPDRGTVAFEQLAVAVQPTLGAAHELQHPGGPFRLGLRVADEGRTQAPIGDARALGEVTQPRQLGGFDLDRHPRQPTRAGEVVSEGEHLAEQGGALFVFVLRRRRGAHRSIHGTSRRSRHSQPSGENPHAASHSAAGQAR